ncbi:Cohesin subunit SA-3 SCC3 -like protein 3 [Collichthys lucidus]|uniref:Cohesin subunit SA-3 SCC3-like protein 3 n=1 Tax=Collichthys lucidus TaxID=240159 RepID=A0A4U5UCI9_COLLU|nr:Cohesin subunit SA-3 SCC3 -like protein 3 [Collichthys lucidus]
MRATKGRRQAVPGPLPPKRPRRKAALKVPTPPDPSPQQHPRGTRRQASPRPVKDVNKGNQGISAEDIYEAVRSGKSAMVTVVDEWLDSYKRSREAGLLVLINFIVRSCGCKGVVSREMFDSMQNAEIISTLTREFNEGVPGVWLTSSPNLSTHLLEENQAELPRLVLPADET